MQLRLVRLGDAPAARHALWVALGVRVLRRKVLSRNAPARAPVAVQGQAEPRGVRVAHQPLEQRGGRLGHLGPHTQGGHAGRVRRRRRRVPGFFGVGVGGGFAARAEAGHHRKLAEVPARVERLLHLLLQERLGARVLRTLRASFSVRGVGPHLAVVLLGVLRRRLGGGGDGLRRLRRRQALLLRAEKKMRFRRASGGRQP
mmetsp:Transcript_10909/g.46570  ORF Transcript_10909/g.46570 Transcript_10909/m.46570 type:complete len:201 (+) Transcript_10909:1112-1714(+)